MILKEYIEMLNELVKSNPELLDLIVIYANNEEGDFYDQVVSLPVGGLYGDGCFNPTITKPNAVCIN